MEDDLQWKKTFGREASSKQGRRFDMLTVLTNINQGVMVGGRRPLVEDDLRWKTTFGGRQSSVEDKL